MDSDTVIIRCPNCGKILRLNRVFGLEHKIIPCPVCGKKTPYSMCEQVVKRVVSTEDTVIPGTKHEDRALLIDKSTGRSYPLPIGKSVVGRSTASGVADVKIETEDKGVSRKHMVIEVRKTPSGSIRCSITNAENKNKTFLNREPIEDGDILPLNDGDVITTSNSEYHIQID